MKVTIYEKEQYAVIKQGRIEIVVSGDYSLAVADTIHKFQPRKLKISRKR